MTAPATITYGYYANGQRASVSVASSALNQSNALTYSYRADGLLKTQAVNATASGSWSKTYTDAGRLTNVSGSDTQAKGYDTAGQLTSHTLSAGSIAYTYDPEGSPLTEVITNNATASSGQQVNTVTTTFNVRGELVDNTAADLSGHTRTRTNSGCLSKVTIPADLSAYDPTTDSSVDPTTCDRINGLAQNKNGISTVDYNGTSWPVGSSQASTFDATGRQIASVNTFAGFGSIGQNENRPSVSPGSVATRNQATVTTSYDAENHTRVRTHTSKKTRTNTDTNVATTTNTGPTQVTIGWGPNGHPALVPSFASQYETLHWDGDIVLFITDASGNLVDFKAGLDGDITPRDTFFTGLTVYDRDTSGAVIELSNTSGSSGLNPTDPSALFTYGIAYGSSFSSPQVEAQYLRGDGFMLDGLQISGVRAYDPNLAAWTTPDAYEAEIHDPASQQKYMWNNGNPVDYEDPSGFFIMAHGDWWNADGLCRMCNFIGIGRGKRKKAGGGIDIPAIIKSILKRVEDGLYPVKPGSSGGPGAGRPFKARQNRENKVKCECCRACGRPASQAKIQGDHVIPKSLGGNNSDENWEGLCLFCNPSKGANTPDEWIQRLQRGQDPPKRP